MYKADSRAPLFGIAFVIEMRDLRPGRIPENLE